MALAERSGSVGAHSDNELVEGGRWKKKKEEEKKKKKKKKRKKKKKET